MAVPRLLLDCWMVAWWRLRPGFAGTAGGVVLVDACRFPHKLRECCYCGGVVSRKSWFGWMGMGSSRIMLVCWDAVPFRLVCRILGGRGRKVRGGKIWGSVMGYFAFSVLPPGRMIWTAWMWGSFADRVKFLDDELRSRVRDSRIWFLCAAWLLPAVSRLMLDCLTVVR